MILKLTYDLLNNPKTATKEIQSNASDEDIKALFTIVFGNAYNPKTCRYEIIKEGD